MYIAAVYLAPVLAIHGQFQAAEDYLSKAMKCASTMGLDDEDMHKIFPHMVAALCGNTADAQRLVQQSLDSRDLQKRTHGKFPQGPGKVLWSKPECSLLSLSQSLTLIFSQSWYLLYSLTVLFLLLLLFIRACSPVQI